ncbi:MAG: hypothetical protein ABF696_06175 [Acetobacter orientalis]
MPHSWQFHVSQPSKATTREGGCLGVGRGQGHGQAGSQVILHRKGKGRRTGWPVPSATFPPLSIKNALVRL